MNPDDAMQGRVHGEQAATHDLSETQVAPDQWLEDEEVWSPTGTLYITHDVAGPVVRPNRFQRLPPGVNYALLVLLLALILLAVFGFVQVGHAVHSLATPTPTIVPTHTVHPGTPTVAPKK